jgi:hypothetical protein
MADKHPYFNAKHSTTEETDITLTVTEAAARSWENEGRFGPQIQYPMTIQINEIESRGATVDGDNNPVKEGALYAWFCPENVFRKIAAKECNSAESSFIISRPATAQPKESVIQISRAKSGGPNVEIGGASNGSASNGHANGNGNGHYSGHANGESNGQVSSVDKTDELMNILGIGVECYVLTDRFLNSPKVAKINADRGFEYGVDEYLKVFNYFQFKLQDGLKRTQEPHLTDFKAGFEKLEEAIRAEAEQAARVKAEEETEKAQEPEPQEEPVSANGASGDDDLPF